MKTYICPYIVLAFLAVLLGGSFSNANAQNTRLKVITFNVKSFEMVDMSNQVLFDVTPFADFLRDENADFIILNEMENRSSRQQRDGKYRDVVQELAEKLGMFGIFGYAYNLGNKTGDNPEENYTYCMNELYGNAILSKYPILSSQAMQLPRPTGSADQRGVLVTEVVMPTGEMIRVVATHLDHIGGQDEQAQLLISDQVINDNVPTILAGDMNSSPSSSAMETVKTKFDIISNTWVDYIFASKGDWKKISEYVKQSGNLSDHNAMISEIELIKK
ncbi:endonuclease/exonuclease/phosphatase family protein [uncultured Bacteroides sp.]|jgi:endonuclease/exonuclease/phosphatase family metal-dependent hydrolase|uniref:endonuclease/exonuclease/phosphatase family protein n=1 Tax=uncultured Bacteroides sp. TaxID=162156 RepID=UPI00258D4528|nr:endonuclease/exonuclease/phosphatase family protein [uncultured Bacteroides sp.]